MGKIKGVINTAGVVLVRTILLSLIIGLCVGCRRPIPFIVESRLVRSGDILYVRLSGEPVQARVFSLNKPARVWCLVMSGREYRDGLVSKDSYVRQYTQVMFYADELTWQQVAP